MNAASRSPLVFPPTKAQTIRARLADLAFRLGPGAKLPTVLALRDDLGVSVATVNGALADLEARGIVERRHGVGVFVSPQLFKRRVSLVCDPAFFCTPGTSPFWSLLVERVRERARVEDEELSFHFALPAAAHGDTRGGGGAGMPHDGLARDIAAGRVHGVLAVGLSLAAVDWITAQSVPVVAFAGPGRYLVVLDDETMIRHGVAALAGQGCRRIGLWRPDPSPDAASENGALAFRAALQAHGLDWDPELVSTERHLLAGGAPVGANGCLAAGLTKREQGYYLARGVFGAPAVASGPLPRPDGVLCSDDMLTSGVLLALHKRGLRPGRDIAVATHANAGSPVLVGDENALIRIEFDPAALVGAMFAHLETLMRGQNPPEPVVFIGPQIREPFKDKDEAAKEVT